MSFEKQQAEVVLLNQIGKEELAKAMVELIEGNCGLRRAILEVIYGIARIS